jgi:hypothetical protein
MNNLQKVNFLSINIMTHKLKTKTYFKKTVILDDITGLFYFDQFENILIRNRFNRLPANARIVQFDDDFNDFVCDLEHTKKVTHMIFGKSFNKPIIGCIPRTIRYLLFGMHFNQSIDNDAIPNSVVNLKFGRRFNQSIKDNIPSSVKYLTFGKGFTYVENKMTLDALINLQLPYYWLRYQVESLPSNLTYLVITYSRDIFEIPSSVIRLHLLIDTRVPGPLAKNCIPVGVIFLTITSLLDIDIANIIPHTTRRLRLEAFSNVINLSESLPLSLKRLELSSHIYDKFILKNDRPGLKIKRLK